MGYVLNDVVKETVSPGGTSSLAKVLSSSRPNDYNGGRTEISVSVEGVNGHSCQVQEIVPARGGGAASAPLNIEGAVFTVSGSLGIAVFGRKDIQVAVTGGTGDVTVTIDD